LMLENRQWACGGSLAINLITLPILSSHFSRNRHHRPAPKSVR
jgi:hypothetical protein